MIYGIPQERRDLDLNSIFYKEACICLIVYDITNLESFESIKDYWYNSVKENAIPEVLLAIAGNKMDLINKEAVAQEEAEKFCKEINAQFFLTSAKENDFIDQIFEELAKKFIESDIFKKLMIKREKVNLNKAKKDKKGCC